MARYVCDIEVLRNNEYDPDNCCTLSKKNKFTEWLKVPSDTLVPGDIIKVPENIILPCDLLVLQGSCIVNEAILTGESIPVMKQSLPNVNHETYSVD